MIFLPSNFQFTPSALAPLMTAGLSFLSILYFLGFHRGSRFNRLLIYFCLTVAVQYILMALAFAARQPRLGGLLFYSFHIGLAIIPILIYSMASVATNIYPRNRVFIRVLCVLAMAVILSFWFPGGTVGFASYYWGASYLSVILPAALLIYTVLCFVLALINLNRYYRWLTDPIQRVRVWFLFAAIGLSFLMYVDLLPVMGIDFFPVGYLFGLGAVITLGFMFIKCIQLESKQREQNLKDSIEEKAAEVARATKELKAIQLKMIETSKLSAIASLGAGILHQISQPVTAIHGFVRFMKKEMKPTDPFYKPVELMEEQSTYIKDMLEDLMELIRHREIQKKEVDVNDSIDRVTNLLTDELRIRRIKWETRLDREVPHVYADAVHLQQIFMNIIVNAAQAMAGLPKGTIRRLNITTRFDKKDNRVEVLFEDNGPGLSEEDKSQIFELFFTTKTKGAGIGLALSKDLITEHGGEFLAENKPDMGAVFKVRLPPISPDKEGQRRVHKLE